MINFDVVFVVDFLKSMYVRDVVFLCIGCVKVEVVRFVKELVGAWFGAVVFVGESIGFLFIFDGAVIAQFLKQTEFNEMPVGGTVIVCVFECACEILVCDPRSKDH